MLQVLKAPFCAPPHCLVLISRSFNNWEVQRAIRLGRMGVEKTFVNALAHKACLIRPSELF